MKSFSRAVLPVGAFFVASVTHSACFGSATPRTTSTTSSTTSTSSTTTTVASPTHSITPSTADVASMLVAFKNFRVGQGAMKLSDKITTCASCAHSAVVEAYYATQNRDYAILYAQFIGTASYTAQVAAQDGGMDALFWRTPGGAWVVWVENLPSAPCASEFPTAISHLFSLMQYSSCRASYPIPLH